MLVHAQVLSSRYPQTCCCPGISTSLPAKEDGDTPGRGSTSRGVSLLPRCFRITEASSCWPSRGAPQQCRGWNGTASMVSPNREPAVIHLFWASCTNLRSIVRHHLQATAPSCRLSGGCGPAVTVSDQNTTRFQYSVTRLLRDENSACFVPQRLDRLRSQTYIPPSRRCLVVSNS
jgi:hypothetical protein